MPATLTAPVSRAATTPAKRLMTADEFYEFCHRPENEERSFELVHGEVVEMSRPTIAHGVLALNIGTELKLYSRTNPIGFVAVEAGVVIEKNPDTVRGPDVAFYAHRDGKKLIPKKWSDFPPLVAVEVLSPNDRQRQVSMKISEYLRRGVREVWIINPEERFVVIHHADKSQTHLEQEATIVSSILPGFSCALDVIFEGLDIEAAGT